MGGSDVSSGMNARLLAAAGAALLLAGCGAAAHHPARRTSPTPGRSPLPSASASPSPTPSVTPQTTACRAGQISGTFAGSQALTGSTLLATFLFGDKSATPCTLQGTPSVRLVTSSGGSIPLSLGSYQGPPATGGPVSLRPGDSHPTSGQSGVAELEMTWASSAGGAPSCPSAPEEAAQAEFSIGGVQVTVPITVKGPGQQLAPCEGQVAIGSFSSAG